MKFSKSSQLVVVAAASLAAATLITACQQATQTLTVDFVYVASALAAGANQFGEIDVFEIDSESGSMRQIPTSPFPSEGRNPVAEAVSTDYSSLFVVNQDDNNVVQFLIGTDGKLYSYNTVNTPGIFPLAIATSKSDMFVLDTYQPLPLCSPVDPCSGSIAVYPLIAASGNNPLQIGTPPTNTAVNGQYWPLTLSGANASHIILPTAVNVLANGSFVYVTGYDTSVTPSTGYIFGFWVVPSGASTASPATIPAGVTCPSPTAGGAVQTGTTTDAPGTLCAVPGSPFAAGTQPSAVASDPNNSYVYVADAVRGDVIGYSLTPSGALTEISGSPFPAGNGPSAMVVNPTYPFVYVTNALDATISAFSINSTGALTPIGSFATGLQPVGIGIDPSTNHFLFTVNFLGNTVSNFELSTTAGTLLDAQFSPYATNTNPTSVAAIPHNGTGAGIQPQ